jgi:hypothetical protein
MRENNVVQLRYNCPPLELGNKGVVVLKLADLAPFFEGNPDCNASFSLQPRSLTKEPTQVFKDNSGST